MLYEITEGCCEAVKYACKKRVQSYTKIGKIRAGSYKVLCELERALFSDFLPPLDRAAIAAYAHALCELTDAALIYSRSSPIQYIPTSQKGFDYYCTSLAEIFKESVSLLEKIKKSSDIPRIEEFREKKSRALESICDGIQAPQLLAAQQGLLLSISKAFDTLVELILKSI